MENIELAIVKGQESGTFTLTPTGIQIAEDLSFDQWGLGLRIIKWYHDKSEIALSDWIAWGKEKWGEDKVNGCLEQLEFAQVMVKAAVAIDQIPLDLRYPQLEGSHYVELARSGLKEKDLVKWAKIAAEQGLTPSQLRISIAEGEVVDQAAVKALTHGVITPHGIRQQFDIWLQRVGGFDGIISLEPDIQEEIMGEINEIMELGIKLDKYLTEVATTV